MIQEVKEYREDGSLRYECTKRFLSESEEHLYDRRIGEKGRSFIRINQATKYKKDGSIEWRLIYNSYGKVIGNKDGSLRNLSF